MKGFPSWIEISMWHLSEEAQMDTLVAFYGCGCIFIWGSDGAFSFLTLEGIVLVMYYVDFAIYGLVFICSIIAIVGVSKVGSTSGNNYTYYESGN
jgi:hypothetical protein